MKVSSSFVVRQDPLEDGEKSSIRQRVALVLAVVSIAMIGTGLGTHKVMAEPPVRADSSGTGTSGRAGTASPGTALSNEVVTMSWSGFNPTLPNGLYEV